MAIPSEALELENAHRGPHGKPTLAAAFELFNEAWEQGQRDRELVLHLLFITWYGLIEPKHITGFDEDHATHERLQQSFLRVYNTVADHIEYDPEMLYVVGLMAMLAPWLLGDANEWAERSIRFRKLYRDQRPNGLDPTIFEGRGAYGEYFAGQARVADGY